MTADIEVCRVRLRHYSAPLPDVTAKVQEEFERIRDLIRPGMRIAITAGSRGVRNIDTIIRTLVDCLHEAGARPFIIPAMGSHGGGTAEGQRLVLEEYGITEKNVGAPVLSSMEVVQIGTIETPMTIPVYMDRYAYEADGVIAVNRVKAHTDFHGDHESGIVKMLTIGLGKNAQATAVHLYGADGLKNYIPLISEQVIKSGKIIGALAILEDGYDHTTDLRFARAQEIFSVDSEFLARSKKIMARLPFEKLDVLVIDRMGKEISGTGMDTNVIGRVRIAGQQDIGTQCNRVAVLELTPASHGNALGVGLADVVTGRLANSIDWIATNQNVWTSGFLQRGFLPAVAQTDRDAVDLAIQTCGRPVGKDFRLARIRDTLHLDEIFVSRALFEELAESGAAEQAGDFYPLMFDDSGRISAFET